MRNKPDLISFVEAKTGRVTSAVSSLLLSKGKQNRVPDCGCSCQDIPKDSVVLRVGAVLLEKWIALQNRTVTRSLSLVRVVLLGKRRRDDSPLLE